MKTIKNCLVVAFAATGFALCAASADVANHIGGMLAANESGAAATGAKWGNVGNATDGGIATEFNYGNYNNLTFNFGVTNNICTTGIGDAGVVKITKVTLLASPDKASIPSQITLTQGGTSITTSDVDASGTIDVYNESGEVAATRNAYVLTFSSDELFDTTENIVLSSSANMRFSVMQPANSLFAKGGWTPIIEITGDYTPDTNQPRELVHQYSFDGTTEETSGTPLTFNGGAGDSYVDSGNGQAYVISSSASPYGTGLLIAEADAWSVSAFAKLPSTDNAAIWGIGHHNNEKLYVALTTGTNGQIQVVANPSTADLTAKALITSDIVVDDRTTKYHLYTVTRTPAFLRLYVDGALVGIYEGAVTLPNKQFQLGSVRGGIANTGLVMGYDTAIDEWRIYIGAMTAGEVAALAEEFPVWPKEAAEVPETVSINFIGGASTKSGYPEGKAITEQETAGVVEVAGTDWNQILSDGTAKNIVTNGIALKEVLKNGSTSTGTMTVDVKAANVWDAKGASTPVSGNGRMMYGYLDDGETETDIGAQITVNNIPYSEYTVYVYFGSDASSSGTDYFRQVTVNGTAYPTSAYTWDVEYWGDPLTTHESSSALTLTENGNYVKITGLITPTLSIQGTTSYSYWTYWYFRCGIAGIQIVNTGTRQVTGGEYVADITATPANWNGGNGTGLTKHGGDWENDNTAAITLTNLMDDATLTFDTAVEAAKVNIIQAADKALALKATKTMNVGAFDVSKSAGKVSFDVSTLGSSVALSGTSAKIIPGGTVDFALGENGTMAVTGNGSANNADIQYSLSSGMLTIGASGGNGPFNKSPLTVSGANSILRLTGTDATGYNLMTNPAFTFEDGAQFQIGMRDTLTTPITLRNATAQLMYGCANGGRGLDLFNSNGNVWNIEGTSALTYEASIGDAGKRVNLRQGDWNVNVAKDGVFAVDAVLYGGNGIVKTGAGEMRLNGESEYTGTTTISEGRVYAGNPKALGTGAIAIADGAILEFDLDDFVTITGSVAPFNFADSASWSRVQANPSESHPEITYDPATGKVKLDVSGSGVTGLHISSINPKAKSFDPNGHESSIVYLTNYGPDPVNLKDYKIVRTNYGKKVKASDDDIMPLLDHTVASGETYAVYLSEDYETAEELGGDGKTVKMFGTAMVVPVKVNPKKYPMVRLYDAAGKTVYDEVIVPCEIDDDITVEVGLSTNKIVRYVVNGTTRTEIGPEVNAPYGVKDALNDIELMNARGFIPTTNDYTITLPINPLKTGDAVLEANKIKSVQLEYRFFDKTSMTSSFLDMTKSAKADKTYGDQWAATIPQGELVGKEGKLLQYRVHITDNGDAEWTAPRFCHPELGYEWYGAIVEPGATTRLENLPTMLMFADSVNLAQMDKDVNDQDKTKVPYNARIAIYDTSTHRYYDNVRIDLRGNTSARFYKKSHGLRFSKVAPFTTTNPLDGREWEVRKSSFCTEYADPTYIRQSLSFYLLNKVDSPAPFHYPVRLYLNGEFYQLAFHTERFTDELIEDVYGLNKFVYSYKNIGTFGGGTTGGGIEKKTPDDDNESDLTVLNPYCRRLSDTANGASMTESQKAAVTKTVVTNFDLSAWINYIAIAKITHENDDVWANLSGYINKYDALHNPNGNDLMAPLAYDMNLSWGQWYYGDDSSAGRCGVRPADDPFKSHPLYGGFTIRAHKVSGSEVGYGNRAFEAVFQNEKFRRLYLRRLRTLMDEVLKEPGTPKADTPFWTEYVEPFKALITASGQDVDDDHNKWDYDNIASRAGAIWVWNSALTLDEGYDDLWDNYIEPRRQHLFGKHCVTNTALATGYDKDLKAGIPEKQSAIADLKAKIGYELIEGGIKITNANAETVDISGWVLDGPFVATIPNGTVLDEKDGDVYFVTNRIAYCTAKAATLTDEFIIGNVAAGAEGSAVTLKTAAGEDVIVPAPKSDVITGEYPDGTNIVLTAEATIKIGNATFGKALTFEGKFPATIELQAETTATIPAIATDNALTIDGEGTLAMSNNVTMIAATDLIVSNGVLNLAFVDGAAKTSAVALTGHFKQYGGAIVLDIRSDNAVYGIQINAKNMEAYLEGGTFDVKLAGGEKSAAIKLEKGSSHANLKGGTTTFALSGPTNRFINTDGKIKIGKDYAVRDFRSTGLDARVFNAKKLIEISGGVVTGEATGTGSEIFSADGDDLKDGDVPIAISGGVISVTAADDCFSAPKIVITGGKVQALSTGGDAIDANGDVSIEGGYVFATTTFAGGYGIEADGNFVITGGRVVAVGAPNYIHAPDEGSITCYTNANIVSLKKYLELTSDYLDYTEKLSVNLNAGEKRCADGFSLVAVVPNMYGTYADNDTKPSKQKPAGEKLDDDLDGVFVTIVEKMTPSIVPGGEAVTYETEEAATSQAAKTVVTRPAEVAASDVVGEAEYAAMFDVKAVQTATSTWELQPELKASVSNEVQVAVDAAISNATLMTTMATAAPTADVATKAGLYYGLAAADAVGDVETVGIPFERWVLGTGARQELKADRPGEAAGFYTIRVQIEPPRK